MLHSAQDGCQRSQSGILSAGNRGQPDKCVQFINGSVSFYPQRILRDTLPAHQAGLARVATFGVNTVQSDTRLIECFVAHLPMEAQKKEAVTASDSQDGIRNSLHADPN